MGEKRPTLFRRLLTWLRDDPPPSEAELVELRARSAVESILDNESLTDGLDDKSAQVLIKWACTVARSLAQRDGENFDEKLHSLRLLLRAINRWVSSQPLTAHADEHPVLTEILEKAAVVNGMRLPDDKPAMLDAIKKMVGPAPEPAALIQGMLTWLDQSTSKE